MDDDLAKRIRDEVFHAKTLVRSVRNSTKNVAAALADSEERLDALIEELESTYPHARRRPREHDRRSPAHAQAGQ